MIYIMIVDLNKYIDESFILKYYDNTDVIEINKEYYTNNKIKNLNDLQLL